MDALRTIRDKGFILEIDDGDLLVSPADKLTDEQLLWIREHKAELLSALAANDPPPFQTGKHQGKSWGEWNGWIVGASETERAEALATMPDHWRFHVQAHLDSVNELKRRAECRS